MHVETIRVKQPSWVRIVNPEPIEVLGMTYRYGDDVRVAPGGAFHLITRHAARALAFYAAPHPPTERKECPSDALLFATPQDLRLTAEGLVGGSEPYERKLPEWAPHPPTGRALPGAVARVPKTRMVRAYVGGAERIDARLRAGGPFRETPVVTRHCGRSEWVPIRPHGTMTVVGVDGPMLKVVYRGDPCQPGDQLVSGAWFRISEDEFLRMDDEYRRMREFEALERAIVVSLLASM